MASRKSSRSSDFGGGRVEIRDVEKPRDMRCRSASGAGQRAVDIGRGAGVPPHPIVDQRVAGPGVEGEDFVASVADPGHIGDAADVEDRERLWQRRRRARRGTAERAALPRRRRRHRRERKSATTSSPSKSRQQRAVADLPGAALGRAVQDRVAVKADDVDTRCRDARARNCSTAVGVKPGQLVFDLGYSGRRRRAPSAIFRGTPPGRGSSAPGPATTRSRPSVSISARHRCRRARCRSSARSRATSAGSVVARPAPMLDDAAMSTPRSAFLVDRARARLHPSMHRFRGARRAALRRARSPPMSATTARPTACMSAASCRSCCCACSSNAGTSRSC